MGPVQSHPTLPSSYCPIIFSSFLEILIYIIHLWIILIVYHHPVSLTFCKSRVLCTSFSQLYPGPEDLEPQSRCSVNMSSEWMVGLHQSYDMGTLFKYTCGWFRKLLDITGQKGEVPGLKCGPHSSQPEISVLDLSPPLCYNLEHNY